MSQDRAVAHTSATLEGCWGIYHAIVQALAQNQQWVRHMQKRYAVNNACRPLDAVCGPAMIKLELLGPELIQISRAPQGTSFMKHHDVTDRACVSNVWLGGAVMIPPFSTGSDQVNAQTVSDRATSAEVWTLLLLGVASAYESTLCMSSIFSRNGILTS